MTNEKAIKLLMRMQEPEPYEPQITEEAFMALQLAIDAIRKQIPKEPYKNLIEYPYMPDVTVVQCPNCKRRLRTKRTTAKGDKHCPDCGQAIRWGD